MNYTITDFIKLWNERMVDENLDERAGQAAFNTLHEIRPDLAEQIRNKFSADPYYVDTHIPTFLSELTQHFPN